MDEQRKKAFEFAQEVAKQLITLSTGVIAITLTYSKDFAPQASKTLVIWAWYCFLVSILFGVWTLMALTGTLGRVHPTQPPCINGRNITTPAVLQILSFLGGMLFAILFGMSAFAPAKTGLKSHSAAPSQQMEDRLVRK